MEKLLKEKEEINNFENKLKNDYDLKKLSLSFSNNKITLNNILVSDRGLGTGTKVLNEIIKYADNKSVPVMLTPDKIESTTSKKRLVEFYKKFGFVENKGKNKDCEIFEAMYRKAKMKQIKSLKI